MWICQDALGACSEEGGEELESELEPVVELVERVCHLLEGQVVGVFQAVVEVLEDLWSVCCPDERTCGSASLHRCRLHFLPCHWLPVVEDCCFSSYMRIKKGLVNTKLFLSYF